MKHANFVVMTRLESSLLTVPLSGSLKQKMRAIMDVLVGFVRTKRSKKQEKAPEGNSRKEFDGFSILADDDLEHL